FFARVASGTRVQAYRRGNPRREARAISFQVPDAGTPPTAEKPLRLPVAQERLAREPPLRHGTPLADGQRGRRALARGLDTLSGAGQRPAQASSASSR